MRDAPPTRTKVVALDQIFPGIPRWELVRSLHPRQVRYSIPLQLQVALHLAAARR